MSPGVAPTILFVDDDKEYHEAYGSLFRGAGYGVQEAATGSEALRLALQNPDLVVMDVNLPDMNGYEVCRRIKTHPATHAIPVLHLSRDLVRSQERAQSLNDGADASLAKPAAPEELLAHVNALLRMRQEEDQLRAAARQWKIALDATSEAVCLFDTGGKILRCNKAMARLLHLPFAAIVGQPGHALLQAALAPGVVPDLTREHRPGQRTEVSLGGRCFHVASDPMRDDDGRVSGSVLIFTDITEFKAANKDRARLLAERVRLADHARLLLESTGEGICGIDQEGRCTFINRAGATMLGYAPDEFMGLDFHDAVHRSHADGRPCPKGECPILKAIATARGCRIDSGLLWRRDGSSFPAAYSAHPIYTDAGAVCGAVVTFNDITERLQLEQQLVQSQKMDAIGRLAGGVAHDFNNLMAVVLGNVSVLLAACPEGHADQPVLLAISQSAWRASDLTRRLLGFSRQSRLTLKPTDLRAAVQETVALLGRTFDPRIVLQVDNAPDLWAVQADLGHINQALMNLCLNARDAMPEGGRLLLQTENVALDARRAQEQTADARPGEFVRVRVTDTGQGIPEAIRPRIFEPFFSTKEPGKGTGLGLALVFGIIKQHQGWITCNSEVNRGTRFDIYLPRTQAWPSCPTASAAVPGPGGRAGATILLVEDEACLRSLFQKFLTDVGYQVILAADGHEAVQKYRQHQETIDLVVLDLIMPRLSGRDTLRQLREINPAVDAVYISGYSSKITEVMNDTVLDFLAKPFRPEELVATVRGALDKAAKPAAG